MSSIAAPSFGGNPERRPRLLGSAVKFALHDPGAVRALHHARAVWGAASDIQAINEDCFVLLVIPDDASAKALEPEGMAA